MSRDPATPAELHAAAVECAEASVAMYETRQVAADAWRTYLADDLSEVGERTPLFIAYEAAVATETAAILRHRAATQAWLAIKPTDPKETP